MSFFGILDKNSKGLAKHPVCRHKTVYYNEFTGHAFRPVMAEKREIALGLWKDGNAMAGRRTSSALSSAAVVGLLRTGPILSAAVLSLLKFMWLAMKRVSRRLQPVSFFLFFAIIAFLVGFIVFSEKVSGLQPPMLDGPVDGIVVLTGGQSRIQAAVELLKDKHGQRLLISGVNPATNKEALQRATQTEQGLFDCCVDLDRSALNTVGNAEESERWIRANGYHRVIVVTNNYHIPRSILEMSHRMKDVEFIPYPVVSGENRENSWIAEGDALRVLFTEYAKYLGAVIRIGWLRIVGDGR